MKKKKKTLNPTENTQAKKKKSTIKQKNSYQHFLRIFRHQTLMEEILLA